MNFLGINEEQNQTQLGEISWKQFRLNYNHYWFICIYPVFFLHCFWYQISSVQKKNFQLQNGST